MAGNEPDELDRLLDEAIEELRRITDKLEESRQLANAGKKGDH